MKLTNFFFKKRDNSNMFSNLNKDNIPNSINALKSNHFEVLERVNGYKKGTRPQGIVNAYHNNVPKLIKRFIKLGLLQNQTKEDFLNSLKVIELKEILRNRNLKVSGKKSELIDRILSNVPENDYIDKIKSDIYFISPLGKKCLENYKALKKQEEYIYWKDCINLISKKKINSAYKKICFHKMNWPNGSMVNWKHEYQHGLNKAMEKVLIKQLNYSDENDIILSTNIKIFNACCIFCYLSGYHPTKVPNIYSIITKQKLDKENINQLYFRANTIMSNISSLRDLIRYKEDGTKKYKILCTYDNETCDICGNMDEKIFFVKNAKIGVNFPPLHKNCRCTTVANFDNIENDSSEKVARDINGKTIYIPSSLNFSEYKKQYLQK